MKYSSRIGRWIFAFGLLVGSTSVATVDAGSAVYIYSTPGGRVDGAGEAIKSETQAVPEPSTISLAVTAMGLIGTAVVFRRRRAAL